MRWDISRHLTRKDVIHYAERINPFLKKCVVSFRLSDIDHELSDINRAEYLDAHEEIVRQFGSTTSSFIEKCCEAFLIAEAVLTGESNGSNLSDELVAALTQYQSLEE